MSHAHPHPSRIAARGLCVAALALLLGLAAAPRAQARQGLYAGLGLARQSLASGISGTETYTAAPSEVRIGKPKSGTGLGFEGGFGFNRYVALELLLAVSGHDTLFDPGGGAALLPYRATFSAVQFGVRLNAPLGDVAEVFTRAGLGGYELAYSGNNIASGAVVDDSRFSGRGYGLGAGVELFLGRVGLQLGYTVNRADFKTVQSKNFGGAVSPALQPTFDTVTLLLTYSLP